VRRGRSFQSVFIARRGWMGPPTPEVCTVFETGTSYKWLFLKYILQNKILSTSCWSHYIYHIFTYLFAIEKNFSLTNYLWYLAQHCFGSLVYRLKNLYFCIQALRIIPLLRSHTYLTETRNLRRRLFAA